MHKLKNGQKNTTHISSCLCLNNKQMLNFFLKKDIQIFVNCLKRFNFNSFAKGLILFYQATFSYFLGGNCRYYPSCSHYAHEAFSKYRFFSAAVIVLRRLLSCHPFSKRSFYDPVPLNSREKSQLL